MSIARLKALRLVGFKSFAEKTVVEFGPGISAVVGPNGSGKSNLADALRWALGEQGRSLRTRRSEDVIFAGSARRHGTGMADVALLMDNGDRLLPLDFAEVELGRRLFRSGENEYLLNRQRVRLRDLVELLDAANLADNAFLFIGQGMVDQALALRPEERRPLFEEVAGVRRHERRRRQAEGELTEAETNLERVRDIVAELRPQARRLAAQAAQQAAREDAGNELAAASVAAGRARWTAADRTAAEALARLRAARRTSEAALGALRAAEQELASVMHSLAAHADTERDRRAALDEVRGALLEARLAEARARSESEAALRDHARITAERDATAQRSDEARRALASQALVGDDEAAERQDDDERAEVEEALATALAALREAQRTRAAEGEREAAARRAAEARVAELERARRRVTDLERRAGEARVVAERTARAAADTRARGTAAAQEAAAAARAEAVAETKLTEARATHEAADERRRRAVSRAATLAERAGVLRARVASLDAALESTGPDRLSGSARRRGVRRVLEGVEVDRALGPAVEVALGDAVRGAVVEADAVAGLAARGGGVLSIAGTRRAAVPAAAAASEASAVHAARSAGGGPLGEALRHDPEGVVGRLLMGVLWAPDLAAALALRELLPFGWRVATPDGQLVGEDGIVRLGGHDAVFERRAERDRLAAELDAEEVERTAADAAVTGASAALRDAGDRLAAARRALDAARRDRRVADDDERTAVRAAETAARESGWQAAQLERTESELARAREAIQPVDPQGGLWASHPAPASPASATGASEHSAGTGGAAPGSDLAEQERHVARLRTRRDALVSDAARRRAERERLTEQRRRTEIALAMDEQRLAELDAEGRRLVEARADGDAALERLAAALVEANAAEVTAQRQLAAALAVTGAARAQLEGLERAAADARERLRVAEGHSRDAELADMEARLGLEAVREGLLVELGAIGAPGVAALLAEGEPGDTRGAAPAAASAASGEASAPDLVPALEAAISRWRSADRESPPAAPPVTATRLATLRRRFHDLGATNPFAAEELEEVSERLTALESQRADLERAIASTRQLIGDLSILVATKFRDTFVQLEGAFGRRFQQLFDGGEAQLILTAPDDLAITGIEITARPPGKKRQPLAMLSGGERALTAVALLFAMLEVRPVPFCVLDEVDAALDEANVGRFGTALRSLAHDIQFVVITHNRATIEAADAMYGVTVGDDAVSRVVSMRMGDPAGIPAGPRYDGAASLAS